MDRVWDTYKYHPKITEITFQAKVIQGHEVKKVKLKILGLGGVIHGVMSVFVRNAKK